MITMVNCRSQNDEWKQFHFSLQPCNCIRKLLGWVKWDRYMEPEIKLTWFPPTTAMQRGGTISVLKLEYKWLLFHCF